MTTRMLILSARDAHRRRRWQMLIAAAAAMGLFAAMAGAVTAVWLLFALIPLGAEAITPLGLAVLIAASALGASGMFGALCTVIVGFLAVAAELVSTGRLRLMLLLNRLTVCHKAFLLGLLMAAWCALACAPSMGLIVLALNASGVARFGLIVGSVGMAAAVGVPLALRMAFAPMLLAQKPQSTVTSALRHAFALEKVHRRTIRQSAAHYLGVSLLIALPLLTALAFLSLLLSVWGVGLFILGCGGITLTLALYWLRIPAAMAMLAAS